MKVNCLDGFFLFEETKVSQVSDFIGLTGYSISRYKDVYSFTQLIAAEDYCLKGKPYLGATINQTYEGEPWDIFMANNLVYNFSTGLVVSFPLVTDIIKIFNAGDRYLSNGLIIPGSISNLGKVRSYSGYFSRSTFRWSYSEIEFE